MTSSNNGTPDNIVNHTSDEHLVPSLSKEVVKKCTNGVYKIELPELVEGKVQLGDGYAPTIQMRCQSLYTKRPNEVHCCNSVVKTIVGRGRGDQTEIVECGKCRTAYVIRTKYDENGKLIINTSVWNTPRSLDKYCKCKRDKSYGVWVEFNSDEEKK